MAHRTLYAIEGIDCSTCALKVEKAVGSIKGIESSKIDLVNNRLEIISNSIIDKNVENKIKFVVKRQEPDAVVSTLDEKVESKRKSFSLPLLRLLTTLILFTLAQWILKSYSTPLFIIAYVISGYDVVYRAVRNIFHGDFFDEHFLMSIATIGAFAIGDFAEAVAVMTFYQAGEYLQSLAVNRSRRSISQLIDIKPTRATLLKDGKQVEVKPEEIKPGDLLLIRSGEKIAVDAVVTSGESLLDTKAITGESMPLLVNKGDKIISGCVNGSGVLEAKALTAYEDSTVATILRLVEESSLNKAQSERFITRFARYYTPIVVSLALLIAIVGPIITQGSFNDWLYRALVFLVISCPCALVISVPLGFFGGIGGLAKMGVLVKGGTFIQEMAKAKSVVFDKTGTLTKGNFSVKESVSLNNQYNEKEILELAAAVEASSNHPIGYAIATHQNPKIGLANNIVEKVGHGIEGTINQKTVAVGSKKYIEEITKTAIEIDETNRVFVAIDHKLAGFITLSDTIKGEAIKAVSTLKKIGVNDLVVLSGDNEKSVKEVASNLKIDRYYHSLLPQDKVNHIESLLKTKDQQSSLIFVGDGINDAPVLARSDIGIAMGAMGTDAAIEAADVVIMTDNLEKIGSTILHSQRTMSIIRQNITLAIGIKILVMLLGLFGLASMWMAVFADTGVALLAVANSLRSLKQKNF
jgi:Cd2+/Zn2+-exporting ATPase